MLISKPRDVPQSRGRVFGGSPPPCIVVIFGNSQSFIEAVLETIQIRECFDRIVSGEEVPKGKPCPDVFLNTDELLNVNPAECIVIEDSANGVKAALSAGMICIGYANPNSGLQDLSNALAIVASIRDINYGFLNGVHCTQMIKKGIEE